MNRRAHEIIRRQQLLSLMFSYDDPPEHTRKRALVAPPFSAAATARHRPRVAELIDELLDPIATGVEVDLDDAVSARLPVLVTCELLGIPPEDRDRCIGWIELLTSSNQPVLTGPGSEQMLEDADTAADDAASYFLQLLRRRATAPQDDILSELPPLALEAGQYTPDEIAATVLQRARPQGPAGGADALRWTPIDTAIASPW